MRLSIAQTGFPKPGLPCCILSGFVPWGVALLTSQQRHGLSQFLSPDVYLEPRSWSLSCVSLFLDSPPSKWSVSTLDALQGLRAVLDESIVHSIPKVRSCYPAWPCGCWA